MYHRDILRLTMKLDEAVKLLGQSLIQAAGDASMRVAIDGIDTAGKTTLADSLASLLVSSGRNVLRSSIDRFHNPSKVRYSRGENSPEGHYWDSFNYAALTRDLLQPLGPRGKHKVRPGVFAYRTDRTLKGHQQRVPIGTILLFDGVFLLRPEINSYWDFRIFVDVDFDVALKRAENRDQGTMGGTESTRERYLIRYFPGQRLYLSLVKPKEIADVIVNNNDFNNPDLLIQPS